MYRQLLQKQWCSWLPVETKIKDLFFSGNSSALTKRGAQSPQRVIYYDSLSLS